MIKSSKLFIFFFISCASIFAYLNNEDGMYEDMLQPAYYHVTNSNPFRTEINTFVHFARLISFNHPLQNPSGQMPEYSTPLNGEFGAIKGFDPNKQHHAALDMHVGNNETAVNLYAAYDGYVSTTQDVLKYRDYLAITKNVTNESGSEIGKIVALYAHIDVDLDINDGLNLNGSNVVKGQLISKNLYSGTVGGPHLHFEIRYYRNTDIGTESYYGMRLGNPTFTEESTGSWIYGFWDPNVGYGFADMNNQVIPEPTGFLFFNMIFFIYYWKLILR